MSVSATGLCITRLELKGLKGMERLYISSGTKQKSYDASNNS